MKYRDVLIDIKLNQNQAYNSKLILDEACIKEYGMLLMLASPSLNLIQSAHVWNT